MDDQDIIPFTDLVPAIPFSVQLTVTGLFTGLYSIIFFACYVQLWLLMCLGYTRRLHPFGLLWLALVWSGLRILLFSFYWSYFGILKAADNVTVSIQQMDDITVLSPVLAYFLYAFPTFLQFVMLCFVASFAVGISSRNFEDPTRTVRRLRLFLLVISIVFLLVSAAALTLRAGIYINSPTPVWLTAIRVGVQDTLFVFVSVFLVVFLRRVAALPHVSLILESMNTGRCGLLFTGSFLVFTFATRAIYDVVALSLRSIPSFNFAWLDLSDHAGVSNVLGPNVAYAVFAGVLLVWDLLPTALVLFLFRLRRPQFIRAPGTANAAQFWGTENFDDNLQEDWGLRVNTTADDNEALLVENDDHRRMFTSTPTFPVPVDTAQETVKFGVGSIE